MQYFYPYMPESDNSSAHTCPFRGHSVFLNATFKDNLQKYMADLYKGDLVQGNITGTMLRFAFPLMLGNLLQQCYNIADTLIVGRVLCCSTSLRCCFSLPSFACCKHLPKWNRWCTTTCLLSSWA